MTSYGSIESRDTVVLLSMECLRNLKEGYEDEQKRNENEMSKSLSLEQTVANEPHSKAGAILLLL